MKKINSFILLAAAVLSLSNGEITLTDRQTVNGLAQIQDGVKCVLNKDILSLSVRLDSGEFAVELPKAELYSPNSKHQVLSTYQKVDAQGFVTATITEEGCHGVIFRPSLSDEAIEFSHATRLARLLGKARFLELSSASEIDGYFSTAASFEGTGGCGESDDNKDNESAAKIAKFVSSRRRKPHEYHRKLQESLVYYGNDECFGGDNALHKFRMGFVVDKTFLDHHGGSRSRAQRAVEGAIASSNAVYQYQFNVALEIADLKFYGEDGNTNAVFSTCYSGTGASLNQLERYARELVRSDEQQGSWHLLTNCYPLTPGKPSVIGTANLGTSGCHRVMQGWNTAVSTLTNRLWQTVAHEVGHGLAMRHSFEQGIGKTGGIMDYGDGKINGRYRFQPTRGVEGCDLFEYMKATNCRYFHPANGASPVTTKNPTRNPTTARPVRTPVPTRPTGMPTSRPTKAAPTRRPTSPPTPFPTKPPPTPRPTKAAPTVRPTPAVPTQSPTVGCAGKNRRQCRRFRDECVYTRRRCVAKQPLLPAQRPTTFTPQNCPRGDYNQAREHCGSKSLCSYDVIKVADSDPSCGFDDEFVWTSTRCKRGKYFVYSKSTGRRSCKHVRTRNIAIRCC